MTATRRDLLKIASALGLAGTVPTTAERLAVLPLLEQRVSARAALDPARFAGHMDGVMACVGDGIGDEWLRAMGPEEYAALRHAQEDVVRAYPQFASDGRDNMLFGTVSDEAMNFAMMMYNAGLRHGAAYEHLRRSVIGEVTQCRSCWGVGATEREDVCHACGGTGTVAMKA
jgi:hypothetical protein